MRRVGLVSGDSPLGTDPFVYRAIADGARRCALCCYPRVIKNAPSARAVGCRDCLGGWGRMRLALCFRARSDEAAFCGRVW